MSLEIAKNSLTKLCVISNPTTDDICDLDMFAEFLAPHFEDDVWVEQFLGSDDGSVPGDDYLPIVTLHEKKEWCNKIKHLFYL